MLFFSDLNKLIWDLNLIWIDLLIFVFTNLLSTSVLLSKDNSINSFLVNLLVYW